MIDRDRADGRRGSTLEFVAGLATLAAFLLIAQMCFASSAGAVAAKADFYGLDTVGQLQNLWEVEQAQTLGIHNVRVDFAWRQAQTASCDGNSEAGPLNVSVFDNQIRKAAEHDVTIIADLYQSRAACNPKRFPNPGSTMYGAWKLENGNGFVWALVQRYGVNGSFWAEPANSGLPYHPIRIWEVWNEENLPVNNPSESINPQKYAQLLVDSAATIRKAQEQKSGQSVEATGTKVLMGGLAPFSEGMYVTNYLNSVYSSPSGYTAAQFHSAFDGLSYHPYALTGNASNAEQGINDARAALDQSRSALGGASDSSKTLWITELGWPVMKLSSTPNDTLQAQALSEAFLWIYQQADAKKIKFAAWYVNQDSANSCESWSCWDTVTGLRHADGSVRPSWCTYADLIQVNFCNPYPPSWSNDNLGGYSTSDPAISSWESGRLDVFARGGDSRLWHKLRTSSAGWSSWEPLGGAYTSSYPGPDAVSWGPNRIDLVFLNGTTVEHYYWTGSAWGSDNLQGSSTSDPTISSWESGRLDVFARGGDSRLWHRSFTPSTGWSSWEPLGGAYASSYPGPDAVSWGPNRIDLVFLNGTTVEHYYWTGSSWGSDNLQGWGCSAPTIASKDVGQLEVFVRGCADNGLWRNVFTPSTGWSGWAPLYGTLTSGPDAVSWGPNRTDIVAQGYLGNNSMMHAYQGE